MNRNDHFTFQWVIDNWRYKIQKYTSRYKWNAKHLFLLMWYSSRLHNCVINSMVCGTGNHYLVCEKGSFL